MYYRLSIILALCTCTLQAVFNPTAGTPIWNIAAETGIIASAIEGTQTRIQQNDLSGGTYTISSPGRYALVENITYVMGTNMISIEADNVYLDLNGFTIDGANSSVHNIQISSDRSNIYIGNGHLSNAGTNGILLSPGNTNIIIENVTATGAGSVGIALVTAGNAIENVTFNNCNAFNNAAQGFICTGGSNITYTNCIANNNGTHGIDIASSNNILVDGFSTADNGAKGININNTYEVALMHITSFQDTTNGIDLVGTTSLVTIQDFEIFKPGSNGIHGESNVFSVFISNGYVGAAAISGVSLAGTFTVSIENVTVDSSTVMGFSFDGLAQENISLKDCNATNNVLHGYYCIDVNNIQFIACRSENNDGNGFLCRPSSNAEVAHIVLDGCIAQNNSIGILLGNTGNGRASSATIKNCIAQDNSLDGINASVFSSLLQNNQAINNTRSNIRITNNLINTAGNNLIIDNNCLRNSGNDSLSVNFAEDAGTLASLYLGNAATIGSISAGTIDSNNYKMNGTSSPTLLSFSATSATIPASANRWANVSGSL